MVDLLLDEARRGEGALLEYVGWMEVDGTLFLPAVDSFGHSQVEGGHLLVLMALPNLMFLKHSRNVPILVYSVINYLLGFR